MMKPFLAAALALSVLASGCLGTLDDLDAASTVDDVPAFTPSVDANPDVQRLSAAIETAVAEGSPVPLPMKRVGGSNSFGGILATTNIPVDVPLVLEPGTFLAEDAWFEIDEDVVEAPEMRIYEGTVEGQPDHRARLVVTDTWMSGAVLMGSAFYSIRVGLNGNLPYTAVFDDGEDGASALSQHGVARETPHIDAADPVNEDKCLELLPPEFRPTSSLAPEEFSMLTARIILDADGTFLKSLGDDAFPMMVAFLAESDLIYERDVGIRLTAVGVHAHTDENFTLEQSDGHPFDNLVPYWNDRLDRERDVVHLFTGRQFSFAQANCIGGAGEPEIGYTFTPLNWARDYEFFHTTAVAHELGHIFSAHHHYGNHVETVPAGARLATLMIQGYTPGYAPMFSTMSKSSIRGWAEAYLGGDADGSDVPDVAGLTG